MIIISFSILYVMKIHSQNHAQIVYISQRNSMAFQDSLFLTDNVAMYHKEKKSAYDVLSPYFKPKTFKSREILKQIKRDFFIPEPVRLMSDESSGMTVSIEEIKIKDQYSSSYFHFKLH